MQNYPKPQPRGPGLTISSPRLLHIEEAPVQIPVRPGGITACTSTLTCYTSCARVVAAWMDSVGAVRGAAQGSSGRGLTGTGTCLCRCRASAGCQDNQQTYWPLASYPCPFLEPFRSMGNRWGRPSASQNLVPSLSMPGL